MDPDNNGDGEPDIFGPYLLPEFGRDRCEWVDWMHQAHALAIEENPSITDYDNFIYVLPYVDATPERPRSSTGCTFGGMGFVNGKKLALNYNSTLILIHEFGHNLGMSHSRPHDKSCLMGGSLSRLNAPNTVQMGWMTEVRTLTDLGIYELVLRPMTDSEGLRVVVVPVPGGNPYYLSFHNSSRTDLWMEDEYKNGLNLHRLAEDKKNGSDYITTVQPGGYFEDLVNGFIVDSVILDKDRLLITVRTNGE